MGQRRPSAVRTTGARRWWFGVAILAIVAFVVLAGGRAGACGGLFCQNDPVDQVGERIVFSVNADETITSLIEIQYTGSADDFSWILPLPSAISADDLAVPDEGDTIFEELHRLTDVTIIGPPLPECAEEVVLEAATSSDDSGVEIFASGEVGPFDFDVVGSDDPGALIGWLRDNDYRVDASMEPLIDVYVEESFSFLAMRLIDGEDASSIAPIEVTYQGTEPMIPLRLTAVAAQPDMPVFTWIFADAQAVPSNYEHIEIATEELTFSGFGGNDYQTLVRERANALGGRAFITEFAAPSNQVELAHPYLQDLARNHGYLTRLSTVISPEEMTVDPLFQLDADRSDVSNVRDASEMTGLYDCERDGSFSFLNSSDAIDARDSGGNVAAETSRRGGLGLGRLAIIIAIVAGGGFLIGRRGRGGSTPDGTATGG